MIKNLFIAIAFLASITKVGCAQNEANRRSMNSVECGNAKECYVSGALTMSSDGHGFIGVLQTTDGKCVNVSLPERISKKLLGKPAKKIAIHGEVFPYPRGEDILFFEVNRRSIGYGTCGNYYVFVE